MEDEGLEVEICYSELLMHLVMVHSALGNTEQVSQYTIRWTTTQVARGRSLKDVFEDIMTMKRTFVTVFNCRGRRGESSGDVDNVTGKLGEMKV